jgi:hypothetical protein
MEVERRREENWMGSGGGGEMKRGGRGREEKRGKLKWEAGGGRRGVEKGKGRQLICHLLNLIWQRQGKRFKKLY